MRTDVGQPARAATKRGPAWPEVGTPDSVTAGYGPGGGCAVREMFCSDFLEQKHRGGTGRCAEFVLDRPDVGPHRDG